MSSATEAAMPVGAAAPIDAAAERRSSSRRPSVLSLNGTTSICTRSLPLSLPRCSSRPATRPPRCFGAFGAYAAGFPRRPFGRADLRAHGDLVGRKYTFLVTIVVMAWRPCWSASCPRTPPSDSRRRYPGRSPPAQGLALGGEYGGAATYGPSTRRITSVATTRRGSRPPPRWHVSRSVVIGLCARRWRRPRFQLGLAHRVLGVHPAAADLDLHPAQAAGIAGLPAHEDLGQAVQVAHQR